MKFSVDVPSDFKYKRQQEAFGAWTASRAACGLYHSFVIGRRGDVPQLYGWGRNHNNVLALGSDVKERSFPGQIGHFAKNHVFQIACGLNHTAVLVKQFNQSGGKVYTCGLGNKGRLGYTKSKHENETAQTDAWFTPKPVRIKFPDKDKIARISCGADHTLAITDKGTLYAWGVGQYGNLGTGEVGDEYQPVRIEVGSKESFVVNCAAGGKHSLACTKDGTCYSWGHNGNGRLGHGHSRAVLVPTRIEYLVGKDIVSVSAGEAHSAALDRTGLLYTWGAGAFGRLGHGDDADKPVPRKLEELGGVSIVQVACGTFHTLAVSQSGVLYAWGAGLGMGLVSEGDNTAVLIPKQVREGGIGTSVCQVAAGTYHSIALTLTGDVFCWGVGGQSRLGHGDNTNQPFPKYVAELRNKAFIDDIKASMGISTQVEKNPRKPLTGESWKVVQIVCGESHTMILTKAGNMWVWGSNAHGQLGLGEDFEEDVWEPVELKVFREPIRRISCGLHHSLAVSHGGELFVWGSGAQGQLGLGRIMDAYAPVGIANLCGVFDVACGEDYSCCLIAPTGGDSSAKSEGVVFAEAGSLWTWGSCEAGKLGHEGLSSGSCVSPKRVRISVPISRVSCGRSHMVVASPHGDVFAWGAGYYGRLGIGTSANSAVPVRVPFPDDVYIVDVACGAYHSMGLSSQGNIWIWGRDTSVCAEEHIMTPEMFYALEGPEGVPKCKSIVSCGDHSFVITRTGQVWGWGDNTNFQLGLGKKAAEFASQPELLYTLPDDVEIMGSGPNHSLAAFRSGDLFAWGATKDGCLGIGYKKAAKQPTPEPVIGHWVSIDAMIEAEQVQTKSKGGVVSVFDSPQGVGYSIPQVGEYANLEESVEAKVIRFLDRIRYQTDTSVSFPMAQTLLQSEPRLNKETELQFLENDLVKIFGRFFDVILNMSEKELSLKRLECLAETKIGNTITQVQCDAPASLMTLGAIVPHFYLKHLESIQNLVFCLHIQPAYFVSLAASLRSEYERQILVSAVHQIFWNIEDRHVNATILSLCASICDQEIEKAPDLIRLFSPDNSNFIHLFSLYATQLMNLQTMGSQLVDPMTSGSVGFILNNMTSTILALDPQRLKDLIGKSSMSDSDLQKAFRKSLDGLNAAMTSLGSNLTLSPGVAALLKHAYDRIVSREFLFDTEGMNASSFQSYSFYPLLRLLLQGLIGKVLKNPMMYNRLLRKMPFVSKTSEVNYRTLWIFVNSSFEEDFATYSTRHLLREIFQSCYARLTDLIAATISNSPDNYIKVELTLGLYLTHFDTQTHHVTIRSDVMASLLNLLKEHEAHLQLSAYDPIAEIVKKLASGTGPLFSREEIDVLERNQYSYNVYIERRFVLKEKSVVFDAVTSAPVPQRLAFRQQAATKEGRSIISLVHRYLSPDPLDPRAVLQEALRILPPITATQWDALSKEFNILKEFCTRQDPPKYKEAELATKAAKYASENDLADISTQSVLKWIGEGLRQRQRHRSYLVMLQMAEDIIADAERKYQFHLQKRENDLQLIINALSNLKLEPQIKQKMEAERIISYFDNPSRGQDIATAGLPSSDHIRPTVTLTLKSLLNHQIVTSTIMARDDYSSIRITFTSDGVGGWTVQMIQQNKGGEKTIDQFNIPLAEVQRLHHLPLTTEIAYGNKSTMPYGLTRRQYYASVSAAFASFVSGSFVCHLYMRPDENAPDMTSFIDAQREILKKVQQRREEMNTGQSLEDQLDPKSGQLQRKKSFLPEFLGINQNPQFWKMVPRTACPADSKLQVDHKKEGDVIQMNS